MDMRLEPCDILTELTIGDNQLFFSLYLLSRCEIQERQLKADYI